MGWDFVSTGDNLSVSSRHEIQHPAQSDVDGTAFRTKCHSNPVYRPKIRRKNTPLRGIKRRRLVEQVVDDSGVDCSAAVCQRSLNDYRLKVDSVRFSASPDQRYYGECSQASHSLAMKSVVFATTTGTS